MKLLDAIVECLNEFSRVQPNGTLDGLQLRTGEDIPSMLRAVNGMEIWFSSRALECITWIAQDLHQNAKAANAIRVEEFDRIVRQSLVDGHCDGRLTVDSSTLSSDLRRIVNTALKAAQHPLIHSFPGWSIDVGEHVVHVGPVAIYPVEMWLKRQQFTPKIGTAFFTDELPENEWKARFRAYQSGERQPQYRDPACMLASVIADASHVAEVAMPARETILSRNQARLLAQAALDAIALIMDQTTYHRHWILRDQPSGPETYDDITAFESGLWPPNVRKHFHRNPFSAKENWAALNRYNSHIAAFGHVLDVVRNADSNAPNIGLARRWLMALLWASEGAREPNDAMASTKFATSLDIMAQANKSYPIVEMVSHLLGIDTNTVLVKATRKHPNGMTIKQAVEHIYGEGRSQVLHGNIIDPMHRHTLERSIGGWLSRACLRAAVLAIPHTRDAEHKTFKTLSL